MIRLRAEDLKHRCEGSDNAMTRQQRQARGRPNAQEILQRRAAARLVHGNTQRQWNNKWYTWWTTQQSTTRKPRNECCCSKCQGQYSTTYGRIRSNVWSRSNSSLQEHWKGIQRRLPGYGGEVAEFEHRTHQAATTADADGNILHVGRAAAGAPSARIPGFRESSLKGVMPATRSSINFTYV
jgi:hypothetical protein